MNINIQDFDDTFVKFTAYFMNCSTTIWVGDGQLTRAPYGATELCAKEAVRQRFSFGIPNNKCFPKTMFNPAKSIELLADRYGGYGLGPNGGGARTGIIDGYQIKGVGQNPLVGINDNEWHSYGGQSLIDAVLETINSEVFGHILPLGTVKCHAIILTGNDTAYMPTADWEREVGPGALLVRDLCARPAHFLRAATFRAQEEFEKTLLNDVERTRRVNVQLHAVFGDHKQVIQFLGDFLSKCANQFAFARLFGIFHGVLSPSNISFDGRWLDLTNISFVDRAVNYKEGPELTSFYDEIEIVLQFIDEFVHTYTKYNRTEFNIKPLVNYYRDEVDAYISHYVARLFGVCPDWINDHKNSKGYLRLVGKIQQVLSASPKAVVATPTGICVDDPLVCLLEQLFRSFSEDDAACKDELHGSFSDVFEQAYLSAKPVCTYSAFMTGAAIHSLKKAYFSSFFTRGRIVSQLLAMVNKVEPEFFEDYIESHIAVAKWLFEDESSAEAVLFKSPELELSYAADSGKYTVVTNHATDRRFPSVRSLRDWIEGRGEGAFFIDNYDFRPGLLRFLVVLEDLENLKIAEGDLREREIDYV